MRQPKAGTGAALLHVAAPVGLGAAIYLLLRAPHLRVFSWAAEVGLGPTVSLLRVRTLPLREDLAEWVLYSLPDALWVYALTAAMVLVWRGGSGRTRFLWIGSGLALGAGGELGQWIGVVPGTFDPVDLLACGAAALAAILLLLQPRTEPCPESISLPC